MAVTSYNDHENALLVPAAPVKGIHMEREWACPVSNNLRLQKDNCKKNARQPNIEEKIRNQVKREEVGEQTSCKDKEGINKQTPPGV